MERLKTWMARRGYLLRFTDNNNSEVCCARKVVRLQKSLDPPTRLATLLHECGHILVHLSRIKRRTVKVAGASWLDCRVLRRQSRRKLSGLYSLQEEMVAWDRGDRLARRLQIRIPTKLWNNLRMRCLMSYVRDLAGPLRARSS
jgi:hypothetical protein